MMQLTKTSLRGMDVNREWSGVLEKFPLRFAFDDGKVEAVCPHEGDPPWAVNVKRAVLSAFQVIHGKGYKFYSNLYVSKLKKLPF